MDFFKGLLLAILISSLAWVGLYILAVDVFEFSGVTTLAVAGVCLALCSTAFIIGVVVND